MRQSRGAAAELKERRATRATAWLQPLTPDAASLPQTRGRRAHAPRVLRVPAQLPAAEKCRVTRSPRTPYRPCRRRGCCSPVSTPADSRPVVARLDLTSGRPKRLRDAVLPPPVHLSAVVERWGGNGRGGTMGRSGGNTARGWIAEGPVEDRPFVSVAAVVSS
jgi:hypothetical protein